jgi:hypothetical protein
VDGGVEVFGRDVRDPGAIGHVAVVGQARGGVFQRFGGGGVILLRGFLLSGTERGGDRERQGLGPEQQDEGDEGQAVHERGAKRRRSVAPGGRARAPASP